MVKMFSEGRRTAASFGCIVLSLLPVLVGCDRRTVIRVGPSQFVRTPAAARDAVRRLKAENGGQLPKGGVVIEFDDGEYRLDAPLELDAGDSGSPLAPVVWKAKNRGRATFSGAMAIGPWKNVADAKVLSLIPAAARESVLVADVPDALEIPDFHGGSEEMYSKRLNFPLWLYQGDRRLGLARFPNRPSNPREYRPGYIFTGDLTQGKQGAEFKLENQQEKLVAWMREPDLWVYGLFLHDYAI